MPAAWSAASAIEIIHGETLLWAKDMRPFEAFVERVLDPLISPTHEEIGLT